MDLQNIGKSSSINDRYYMDFAEETLKKVFKLRRRMLIDYEH